MNEYTPQKKRLQLSFLINLIIVIMEIITLAMSASNYGFTLFRFYTEDSNIFALIACSLCAYYSLKCLKGHSSAIPLWVKTAKYMATCCLTVTFVVVVCVLAPTAGPGGYQMMLLQGSMLLHHFLGPVLAFISFVFLEKEPLLPKKYSFYALIPTLIYAVIILILNISHLIVGPYPFLHVYEQPVYITILWCIIIIGGAYIFTILLRHLNHMGTKKSQ